MLDVLSSQEPILGPEATNDPYGFFMPMDNKNLVSAVRRNLSPAKKFERMFSDDELEWLFKFSFSGDLSVRHSTNGTIFITGWRLRECYERFQDKIDAILPGASDSVTVGGNFFITPNQYGLHNDSANRKDFEISLINFSANHSRRKYAPWKNIIIPLWQAYPDSKSQLIFFEQRHIDWAHVYNHGGAQKNITSQYTIAEDYQLLQFHDAKGFEIPREQSRVPYDMDHYQKYLSYTPYERLNGLIPEATFDWEPGCPMSFDAFQLHTSNRGNPAWRLKAGLLLTFLQEVI